MHHAPHDRMKTTHAFIASTLVMAAMTVSAFAKSGSGGRSGSFWSGKFGGSTVRSYGSGSPYSAPKYTSPKSTKYTVPKYTAPKNSTPSVRVDRSKIYTPPGVQNYSTTAVRPYVKRGGKYVAPSYRSTPNRSVNDNWSTKGNYNPFTGAKSAQRLMQPGEKR